MAAKLTILTHKIAIQLHIVAVNLSFTVLAPGSQSGNFWIYSRISIMSLSEDNRLVSLPKYIRVIFGSYLGRRTHHSDWIIS